MRKELMFSSKTDQWSTPEMFYNSLDMEFGFTLDPCADDNNHKCEKYYTVDEDGLSKSWSGEIVFCNPPYGRAIADWVCKAYNEVMYGKCPCVVMLLPARTDVKWFHRFVYGKSEVRFIAGRLKFGGSRQPAPFPSMLVIYRKGTNSQECK